MSDWRVSVHGFPVEIRAGGSVSLEHLPQGLRARVQKSLNVFKRESALYLDYEIDPEYTQALWLAKRFRGHVERIGARKKRPDLVY